MNILNEESPKIDNIPYINVELKNHQKAVIYKCIEMEENSKTTIDINNDINISFEQNDSSTSLIDSSLFMNQSDKLEFFILSDPPGSGKTNMILGLIYYYILYQLKLKKEREEEDEEEEDEEDEIKETTLIVVPQNIISQWSSNIQEFSKELKIKFKRLVTYEDMMSFYKNPNMIYRYDIILTTPVEYHNFTQTLKTNFLQIKRVIFDEIDTISTMIQTKINADYIWFVSASFKKDRIGTYFSKIDEKEIDQRTIKCDINFIKSCFPLPEPVYHKYILTNKYIDDVMKYILKDSIIRGINALDYTGMKMEHCKRVPNKDQEAIKLLLDENKLDRETRLIRIEDMKKDIENLKKELEEDDIKITIKIKDNEDNRVKIYREYENRLKLIEKEKTDYENENLLMRDRMKKYRICLCCGIDIDNKEFGENEKKEIYRCECCKTDYCLECIENKYEDEYKKKIKKIEEEIMKIKIKSKELLKNENEEVKKVVEDELKDREENEKKNIKKEEIILECDNSHCLEKLKINDFKKMRLIKKHDKEERSKDRRSKMDILEEILKNNLEDKNRKYIIFSDFTPSFRLIKEILEKLNIKHIELDGGNIKAIDKIIEEYKNGDKRVLLSDSIYFGCGMNLEFTSDIIFLHKMEKTTEKQMIGRAQRPGRKQELNLYYIYNENEENGDEIKYESNTKFYFNEDDSIFIRAQTNEI